MKEIVKFTQEVHVTYILEPYIPADSDSNVYYSTRISLLSSIGKGRQPLGLITSRVVSYDNV